MSEPLKKEQILSVSFEILLYTSTITIVRELGANEK